MKYKIISLILFTALFSSCLNEKLIEIPEFVPPQTDKVVLIEEYTGVGCTNCPDGAITIKAIETQYEGKVISIAIHAGDLSDPLESSKYDFRCDGGVKLDERLGIFANPAATINRFEHEGGELPVYGDKDWEQYVQNELEKENILNLDLSTNYNIENRNLEINIGIIPLKDLAGNFKINVVLTESHIIDSQIDKGELIEDYEFENVLRVMITPYDGQTLGSNLIKDKIINRSFTYTLPEEDGLWVAKNMKVVVFVTGGVDDDFSPVINATQGNIEE